MDENEFSIALGTDVATGGRFDVSDSQRARHIYTIGRTGAGKSTLQRSLILQDIYAGRGVCLIDPHGDSARWLADCIPRARMNDAIYFDAADREWPIGLNPMTDSYDADARELVASEMLAMFKGLFRDSWGGDITPPAHASPARAANNRNGRTPNPAALYWR